MCVDAVQFADPPVAALLEFRRVLASGARLVLSCWEAADPSDERVSPRIRAVNLRRDLPSAGFVEVEVREKPEWREIERRMWQEALAGTGRLRRGGPVPAHRRPTLAGHVRLAAPRVRDRHRTLSPSRCQPVVR
jgi:hypothetical protein